MWSWSGVAIAIGPLLIEESCRKSIAKGDDCSRLSRTFYDDDSATTAMLVLGIIVVAGGFGLGRREREEEVRVSTRPCPRCGRAVEIGVLDCPHCGFDFRAIGAPAPPVPSRWAPPDAAQAAAPPTSDAPQEPVRCPDCGESLDTGEELATHSSEHHEPE